MVPVPGTAQIAEYPARPDTRFRFHGVNATLDLTAADGLVRGSVRYLVSTTDAAATILRLPAVRTEFTSVTWNGRPVEWRAAGDTLVVEFEQAPAAGSRHRLDILYRSDSRFGVHTRPGGFLWTSLLPGAVADWIPSVPHPAIEMPVDFRFLVPEGHTAVSVGRLIAETRNPDGTKLFHWRSETPVATTAWMFASGPFEVTGERGEGLVRVFAVPGTLGEAARARLRERTTEWMEDAAVRTGIPAPYGGLNLVVLPDHRWEITSFGAGAGYVWMNGGTPQAQALRNATAQWFGVRHRALTRDDADLQTWMQAYLAWRINAATAARGGVATDVVGVRNSLWDAYAFRHWVAAVPRFNAPDGQASAAVLDRALPALAGEPGGPQTAAVYDAVARRQTGRAVRPAGRRLMAGPDTLKLELSVLPGDAAGKWELSVRPVGGRPRGRLTLPLLQRVNDTQVPYPVTVAAAGDDLVLTVAGTLQNLSLGDLPDTVAVRMVKPGSFWLYQLRTATVAADRREAAEALGAADLPDAALALQDFFRAERDTSVRAALLRAYARQADARPGTHPMLVSALRDPSPHVRVAAVIALGRYRDSQPVREAVLNTIRTAQDPALVRAAVAAYRGMVPDAQYFDLLRRLLNEDNDHQFAPAILDQFRRSGQEGLIRNRLPALLEADVPYPVRKKALRILLETEKSASFWQETVARYADDADPRIRFEIWDAAGFLEAASRRELVSRQLYNEYDIRVLTRVRAVHIEP